MWSMSLEGLGEGTEKLVNGKQHCDWLVRTGMKGLPQNFHLEYKHQLMLVFPKSNLTIYLPSGISDGKNPSSLKRLLRETPNRRLDQSE